MPDFDARVQDTLIQRVRERGGIIVVRLLAGLHQTRSFRIRTLAVSGALFFGVLSVLGCNERLILGGICFLVYRQKAMNFAKNRATQGAAPKKWN